MIGLMSILQHRRAFNDLGHPLCDNVRQGNWLMDYTANRLVAYPATNAVRVHTRFSCFYTIVLLLFWNLSRTTRMSRYQKGKTRKVKTNLDLLEQEIVSGSGICWAICKSAPHPKQPRQHPTTQFFTGRMPFLPPNQQRQKTLKAHSCF